MMKYRFFPGVMLLLFVCIVPVMVYGTEGRVSEELNEVERLYTSGEIKPAFELLDSLLYRYPEEAEVHFKKAVYQIAVQGRDSHERVMKTASTVNAVSHIETAIDIKPENLLYKSTYAMVLSDIGEEDKAIKVFRELFGSSKFRTDAKYRYIVVNYALTLQSKGLFKEAQYEYEKSLEETDYDERIAFSYVGFLSQLFGLKGMVEFNKNYRKKKGFSERVQYAVCYESAALERYEYAVQCFADLANNPLASKEHKARAAQDVLNIKKKYLDVE